MQYLDGVQIRALRSIMEPDADSWLMEVCEWYSSKYATPLHVTQDLPLDDILMAYYRHQYREMDLDERREKAVYLLETPEERAARELAEDRTEDELLQKAQEHNDKLKIKKLSANAKKAQELLAKMREKKPTEGVKPTSPPPEQVPAQPPEDEVVVNFVPSADFEAELDKPLVPTKPRKA